jgi:hypothetical protein
MHIQNIKIVAWAIVPEYAICGVGGMSAIAPVICDQRKFDSEIRSALRDYRS